MIEVKNLVRKYGDFTAVDDVSFSIEKGEVVGLLGITGRKTTIMKMLMGFLEPSFGSVGVDGYDVQEHSIQIQRRVSSRKFAHLS